MCDKILYGTLT